MELPNEAFPRFHDTETSRGCNNITLLRFVNDLTARATARMNKKDARRESERERERESDHRALATFGSALTTAAEAVGMRSQMRRANAVFETRKRHNNTARKTCRAHEM